MNRRSFIKNAALGAVAVGIAPGEIFSVRGAEAPHLPGPELTRVRVDNTLGLKPSSTCKVLALQAGETSMYVDVVSVNGVRQDGFPTVLPPGKQLYFTFENKSSARKYFHVHADWSFNGEQL